MLFLDGAYDAVRERARPIRSAIRCTNACSSRSVESTAPGAARQRLDRADRADSGAREAAGGGRTAAAAGGAGVRRRRCSDQFSVWLLTDGSAPGSGSVTRHARVAWSFWGKCAQMAVRWRCRGRAVRGFAVVRTWHAPGAALSWLRDAAQNVVYPDYPLRITHATVEIEYGACGDDPAAPTAC
jgi:hypothetical protein